MKTICEPGFKISRDRYLNVLSFADVLLVIYNTASTLQKSIFKSDQMCGQYSVNVSTAKRKQMTFRAKNEYEQEYSN